jgi:hypothetical protein
MTEPTFDSYRDSAVDALEDEREFDEPDLDEHPLMTALGQGLPITMLIDLIDPTGPRSFEMYARELSGKRSIAPSGDTAQTA